MALSSIGSICTFLTNFGDEALLIIRFDPQAFDLYFDFTERINRERFLLDAPDSAGLFRFSEFVPKAGTAIVRLSGLLHILSALDAGIEIDQSGPIRKSTVEGAIQMVLFYLGQAAELFADVFPSEEPPPANGGRTLSGQNPDISASQKILSKSLLVKASDVMDISDISFSLEEIKEIGKEKGYITIKEIGEKYRNKTNNNTINNKSIGRYIKLLGLSNIRRFNNNTIRGYLYSDFINFINSYCEKNVRNVHNVREDVKVKRLQVLSGWQQLVEKCPGKCPDVSGQCSGVSPRDDTTLDEDVKLGGFDCAQDYFREKKKEEKDE